MARTSDDYVQCVAVLPDGSARRVNIYHIRIDSLERARRKLEKGKAAWVSLGDYELLKEELHGSCRRHHDGVPMQAGDR
jgi:hypothetical protein